MTELRAVEIARTFLEKQSLQFGRFRSAHKQDYNEFLNGVEPRYVWSILFDDADGVEPTLPSGFMVDVDDISGVAEFADNL